MPLHEAALHLLVRHSCNRRAARKLIRDGGQDEVIDPLDAGECLIDILLSEHIDGKRVRFGADLARGGSKPQVFNALRCPHGGCRCI